MQSAVLLHVHFVFDFQIKIILFQESVLLIHFKPAFGTFIQLQQYADIYLHLFFLHKLLQKPL